MVQGAARYPVFQLKCTTNYTTLFASYVGNKCSRRPVIYREHVASKNCCHVKLHTISKHFSCRPTTKIEGIPY